MTAKTDDYDEITRVVQLYIDGFNQCDIEKFKEAFHEEAWLFFIDADGDFHSSRVSECFEDWASPPSGSSSARIISVLQVGDAAAVHLEVDGWLDFHSLLRVGGTWKITNKTATHSNR